MNTLRERFTPSLRGRKIATVAMLSLGAVGSLYTGWRYNQFFTAVDERESARIALEEAADNPLLADALPVGLERHFDREIGPGYGEYYDEILIKDRIFSGEGDELAELCFDGLRATRPHDDPKDRSDALQGCEDLGEAHTEYGTISTEVDRLWPTNTDVAIGYGSLALLVAGGGVGLTAFGQAPVTATQRQTA